MMEPGRPRAANAGPLRNKDRRNVNRRISTPRLSKKQQPRADSSNRSLVSFLHCALAMPDPMPSGRRKEHRDLTWDELVQEMEWTGAWLKRVRRLAEDLKLI
jgi:hypothetical protein